MAIKWRKAFQSVRQEPSVWSKIIYTTAVCVFVSVCVCVCVRELECDSTRLSAGLFVYPNRPRVTGKCLAEEVQSCVVVFKNSQCLYILFQQTTYSLFLEK